MRRERGGCNAPTSFKIDAKIIWFFPVDCASVSTWKIRKVGFVASSCVGCLS